MSTDYSDIGFDVNSSEDIYNMIANNPDKLQRYFYGDVQLGILELDSNSWLYYYGNHDGLDGEYCEIVYRNQRTARVGNNGWVSSPDDEVSGLIQIYCNEGGTPFPLNVMIPDAYFYSEIDYGSTLCISMTMFAQYMEIYESFEDYKQKSGNEMVLNGCIPCGTFPLAGHEEEFVPSAEALMSGKVLKVETRKNEYTGNAYLFITFDCAGHEFDIVADPEFAPEGIREGSFIFGTFWISGMLTENDGTGVSDAQLP